MNNLLNGLSKVSQTLSSLVRTISKEIPEPEKYVNRGDLGISISPLLITVDPTYNTRHDGYDSLEEYFKVPAHRTYLEKMKDAYRSGEQLPPPIHVQVRDNQIILRDGHCRLFALMELIAEGTHIALTRVDEWKGDDQQCDMFILKTRAGIPLSPFATGAIYNRMVNHGWTLEQIAAEDGYTQNHVQNQIDLYQMIKPLKMFVLNNIVSASMMLQMLRTSGLRTDQLVQLIEQQVKTKNKGLLKELKDKKAKVAKRKGEEAAENLEVDDETLFAQVMAESEAGSQTFSNTSGRSFLRPSDLKAKALPKKIVEELHTLVKDIDAFSDESRVTKEEGSDVVLMKLNRVEYEKMVDLQKRLNQHDEENLKRLGLTIEDEDAESESANSGELKPMNEAADNQAA